MGELFEKLGIDWRLFIAQLVNFVIFAAVLTKFLWRPITKFLAEREAKIEKGLADAEAAAKKLTAVEADVRAALDSARAEAVVIIGQAEIEAASRARELLERTQEEAKAIVIRAKSEIVRDQAQAVKEAKAELGLLVTTALERVLGKTEARAIDEKLVEEAVAIMRRS